MSGAPEERVGFAPAETGALVAGLRPLQLAIAAGGIALAVALASIVPAGLAPLALAPGIVLVVLGLARIGGELLVDRLLGRVAFIGRRVGHGRFSRSGRRGVLVGGEGIGDPGVGPLEAPAAWGRLRIVAHSLEQGVVGVLLDSRAGTAAGVLLARSDTAPLLDSVEARRRADGFAALLAGLARDARPVRRLSIVARRLPADASEHASWVAQARVAPLASTVVGADAELVDETRAAGAQHDLAITIQLSLRARGRELRSLERAGLSRDAAAGQVVCEELRLVAAALAECGCRVAGALQPALLAEAIRSGVDPGTPERVARIRSASGRAGVAAAAAGPGVLEESWSSVRSEAGFARTLWAAGLPVSCEAGFLAPLVAAAGGSRSVALVIEPLAPRRATRLAQGAVLDAEAEQARREQRGMLETALARRRRQAARQSEVDLAAGHALCRVALYVCVHAQTLAGLDEATALAEHDAARAGIELRILAGEQAAALAYTLPGLAGGLA